MPEPHTAAVPLPPTAEALPAACLLRVLDEIGLGVVVVDADGVLRLQNRAARAELAAGGWLQGDGGRLTLAGDDGALQAALDAALAGQARSLVETAEGGIAVLPLGIDALGGRPAALLLLPSRADAPAALRHFAAARRLTPAETRVLSRLAAGVSPAQVAAEAGVRISTVRSQIAGLRAKTGARSIGELTRMAAALPPLAGGGR